MLIGTSARYDMPNGLDMVQPSLDDLVRVEKKR